MDHLLAIRGFARVVETGAFARAAQSLQIPNATLTRAIQSLERRLGVKLLDRNTRRVSVTRDGVAYYERTRHVLTELDDIEATLARAQSNPRGRLRVDSGGSIASGILIPALHDFCARYPDIELQLGVTDRIVDVIGENIDCAVRSTANDGALISRRIGALAWTTCASRAFLERHKAPATPQDIIDHDLPVAGYFSAQSGAVQPMHFRRDGVPLTVTPRCQIMVNESNAHLAAALAGIGLVHTLDFMVRDAIQRGDLVPVLEAYRPKPMDMYVAYAPSRQLSTKVRVFVDWVSALYAKIEKQQPPSDFDLS